MEIKEIVNCFINSNSQILDISFRLTDDTEDVIRIDNFEYSIAKDYGLDVDLDIFGQIFEDSDYVPLEFKEETFEESDIIAFLTEYYTINPDQLPTAELF